MPGESLNITDDGGVKSPTVVDTSDKPAKADQILDVLEQAEREGLSSPPESVALKHLMNNPGSDGASQLPVVEQ